VAKKKRARVFESRIASGDAATFFTSVNLKCGDRVTYNDCTKYNPTSKGIEVVSGGALCRRFARIVPRDSFLCLQPPPTVPHFCYN
jgi:hypothetical protein